MSRITWLATGEKHCFVQDAFSVWSLSGQRKAMQRAGPREEKRSLQVPKEALGRCYLSTSWDLRQC